MIILHDQSFILFSNFPPVRYNFFFGVNLVERASTYLGNKAPAMSPCIVIFSL